jgi:hypothetical protein
MLLIYTDAAAWAAMAPEENQKAFNDYGTFTQRIIDSGEFVGGDPLQGVDTATTVRVRNGKAASTDGPFAETKEVLGGYYHVNCKDLDRAIELAAAVPDSAIGNGSVEVRPVLELPDMGPS